MLVPCVLSCARVLLKIGKLHRQQTLHTLFFKLSIVKNYLRQSKEFFSLGITYPLILKTLSKTSYSCYSLLGKAGHNRQLFDNVFIDRHCRSSFIGLHQERCWRFIALRFTYWLDKSIQRQRKAVSNE